MRNFGSTIGASEGFDERRVMVPRDCGFMSRQMEAKGFSNVLGASPRKAVGACAASSMAGTVGFCMWSFIRAGKAWNSGEEVRDGSLNQPIGVGLCDGGPVGGMDVSFSKTMPAAEKQ